MVWAACSLHGHGGRYGAQSLLTSRWSRKQRGECGLCRLACFLLLPFWTGAHGVVPLTLREDLPSSVTEMPRGASPRWFQVRLTVRLKPSHFYRPDLTIMRRRDLLSTALLWSLWSHSSLHACAAYQSCWNSSGESRVRICWRHKWCCQGTMM